MSIPKESKERRERGGDDGLQSRKGDDDVRRRRRRRPEGGLEASSGTPFDLSGSGRRGTPVRARTEGLGKHHQALVIGPGGGREPSRARNPTAAFRVWC